MSPLAASFMRCRTPAEFYQLAITFDCTATPSEFAELWNERNILPPEAQAWLASGWESMFAEPTKLQQYHRKQINEYIRAYIGAHSERSDKDLVIAFSGKRGRLFLPLAVWLQYMSDSAVDLVLLQDPLLRFFSGGIPGYGANLAEVLARLGADMNLQGYRRILCLGGSAGGFAALRAGLIAKAANAVCLSGRMPNDGTSAGDTFAVGLDELKGLKKADTAGTRMFCAFGAQYPADRAAAKAFAKAGKALLVPVEGVADHNVAFGLLKQKKLRGFLSETLFA
ncbi:MAG: hypothetical protein ABI399_01375 [Bauldia sp.]